MRTVRMILAAAVALLLTAPGAFAADNQAPIAVNDSYLVSQDHLLTIPAPGVRSNDSDPDGDAVAVTSYSGAVHADSYSVNGDGSVFYDPIAGFAGVDTLTYTLEDSHGATSTATVIITVTESQPPEPVDDLYTIASGSELHVSAPGFLSNDSDPDDDTFVATVITDFEHGTHTADPSGSLDYVPSAGFLGSDTMTYRLIDSSEIVSAVATVTVTVVENDAPVALDDHYTVASGQTLTIPAPGFLANDSDPDGDPLHMDTVTTFSHAASSGFLATGGFNYTSEPGFVGDDTVTYYTEDVYGISSGAATITIAVTPPGAPISLVDDEYATTEGETLAVDAPGVLGNDSLPDDSTLASCADATNGVVTCHADGSLTFAPDSAFVGDATFTYSVDSPANPTAREPTALAPKQALVTIHVTARADGPADPLGEPDGSEALPDTGSEVPPALPMLGVMLTLAGYLAIRRARRPAE